MYEIPPSHVILADGLPHSEHMTPNKDNRSTKEVVIFTIIGVGVIVAVFAAIMLA